MLPVGIVGQFGSLVGPVRRTVLGFAVIVVLALIALAGAGLFLIAALAR